jgi:threonine dehydratase
MRALGAEVVVTGPNLTHAQAVAESMVGDGAVCVVDGEDPWLMAGAASVAHEVIASSEPVDTLIVPVGGGNLIAGSLLARRRLESTVSIVGVQSTAASGATASWLGGGVLQRPCATFAGGLATEEPGELSWRVMDRWLEHMALVDEQDLYAGIATAFRDTGLIVEGAAAATIAALAVHGGDIPGERVALVITGSWLSSGELERSLRG